MGPDFVLVLHFFATATFVVCCFLSFFPRMRNDFGIWLIFLITKVCSSLWFRHVTENSREAVLATSGYLQQYNLLLYTSLCLCLAVSSFYDVKHSTL